MNIAHKLGGWNPMLDDISYQNLLMMGLTMPDYDSKSTGSDNTSSTPNKRMSLFDLMEVAGRKSV